MTRFGGTTSTWGGTVASGDIRAEQQAAVAELGRLSLTGTDLETLKRLSVRFAGDALGAELAAVFEPDERGETLVCRASVGWESAMLHPVALAENAQLAHTFTTLEPAVVADLADERRFVATRRLLEFGVASGASVPIRGAGAPVGVLAVHGRSARSFSAGDVFFLSGVANVLAAAVARDVADAARRASEERRADAAQALAFVADGVVLLDRSGAVRLWNHAAERITGVPAGAVVGVPLEHALPGWAAFGPQVPVVAAEAGLPHPRTLPLDVAGQERWLSITGVAFSDGVVYAFRDVSEERGLERMKSDFIATVSHELRTPLAAVYGAAATLRSRPSLDAGARGRFLAMIEEQSMRLSRIVNGILVASRLDARDEPFELEGLDAARLAREVVDVALRAAPDGFAIEVEAEPGLPPVLAELDRMRQVLANLLENAVKYSGDEPRAKLHVSAVAGGVRFVVRDYGIGIPPEERERIFEKFYRVDPGMSRGVSGTGLGLYIVRELVRRMGGRIAVESPPDGGSAFTVELRAATSAA